MDLVEDLVQPISIGWSISGCQSFGNSNRGQYHEIVPIHLPLMRHMKSLRPYQVGQPQQRQHPPQSGHEQAGKRPAIVLSPKAYNQKVGLALFCPITSKIKGYPFEVQLSTTSKVKGVILADQIKSLDWKNRQATFIQKADVKSIRECLKKVAVLL